MVSKVFVSAMLRVELLTVQIACCMGFERHSVASAGRHPGDAGASRRAGECSAQTSMSRCQEQGTIGACPFRCGKSCAFLHA